MRELGCSRPPRWCGPRRVCLTLVLAGTAALALVNPPTALASPRAAAKPTQTTLAASASRTSYDTVIDFRAQVTSADGTPSGSVTFVDTSTGSVLDSVALAHGSAAFASAALAPGQRSVVAFYDGNQTFSASQSAVAAITVGGSDDVTADQIGTVHDGYQAGGSLDVAALTPKWSVKFPGLSAAVLTYPLLADGRVFTSVWSSSSQSATIYGLSQATGHTDWSARISSLFTMPGLAYDGRTVFAISTEGVLTAFDAATGHVRWSAQIPFQSSFTAAPTGYDGVVYVGGSGDAGTLYAVSEADGVLIWANYVENGDDSSPAVNSTGAYVSYACQQDYRFSLSGELVWHHSSTCDGGGGSTVAVDGGLVYAEGFPGNSDTPLILSAASGGQKGSFTATSIPAFGQSNLYLLQGSDLVATGPLGHPQRWSFTSGTFATPPVADHGNVFVGAANGEVYALTTAGAQAWSASAGSSFASSPYSGLAVGDGLLVAPAGDQLTAFGG